jgi:hypothetical protein
MKILICGDSFAADWQKKYPDQKGWPNLLADKYTVTNIAQAAVSEYKIWQQIKSVDLNKFDTVIISHASPNRIHCKTHPIHADNILHKDSDLIYTDLLAHPDNKDCELAVKFFERYFEIDYYQDICDLICQKILNILGEYTHLNQIHLVNINKKQLYDFLPSYDINKIFTKCRGTTNHLNKKGNQMMYDQIEKSIQEQK